MDPQLMREGHYGSIGRPIGLFEAYRQYQQMTMQESGTTSDFPVYLSNALNKKFFEAYAAAQSQWRQIASIVPLADFKTIKLVGLSELDDLVEVDEEGQYEDSAMTEIDGPTIQLQTFGKTFSLSRRAMINDDLGRFSQLPSTMGRAANRTLAKAVVGVLTTNGNTYDGNPLYGSAHGNKGTAALSETTLPTGITAIRTQTNQNGQRISLNPTMLYHPAELEFTAKRILNSTWIPAPGTSLGNTNVMQGILQPVLEPFLADANDWYLFVDPADAAAVKVGFLNGKEDPTLMAAQGPALLGAGAYDPYELEVDKLTWKVRHDWASTQNEWRGTYKGEVA